MQRFLVHVFDRLCDRLISRMLRRERPGGDSFNLQDVAFYEAARDSAHYWEEHLVSAKAFPNSSMLLRHAVSLARTEGLFLEFGVAGGSSISLIAACASQSRVFGFDSFEGLPEDWRTGYER